MNKPFTPNKYTRYVPALDGTVAPVDVYAVSAAFDIRNQFKDAGAVEAILHGRKKLLAPGMRGSKSALQDVKEARDSLNRAIELEETKELEAQVAGRHVLPSDIGHVDIQNPGRQLLRYPECLDSKDPQDVGRLPPEALASMPEGMKPAPWIVDGVPIPMAARAWKLSGAYWIGSACLGGEPCPVEWSGLYAVPLDTPDPRIPASSEPEATQDAMTARDTGDGWTDDAEHWTDPEDGSRWFLDRSQTTGCAGCREPKACHPCDPAFLDISGDRGPNWQPWKPGNKEAGVQE